METFLPRTNLFRRIIALPQDHGSWVFLLMPLSIGLLAGRVFTLATVWLVIAALSAFLMRQPVTILVKVLSNRRPRRDLPAAIFWTGIYGLAGLLAAAGLIVSGDSFLLLLLIPAIPVFGLHLFLVSRRAERRQMGIELVASGVLALAAPAAFWTATGSPTSTGWWLWLLTWFQSAASIVYAYLRLKQREWKSNPPVAERLIAGARALLYTSFNLAAVGVLCLMHVTPSLLYLPYAVQWAESIYGTFRPAVGQRPVVIGARQTVVSAIFTVLFVLLWR